MNKSILIVEDEAELCLTLGDRLRSEGYVVDLAEDGRVGLEKAIRLPYSLIVLDIMLPFRNGLDLCMDIRRAGKSTPILLLTARSHATDRVVGLKLGADDYLTKPFDTLELMARIEALLRRSPIKAGINNANTPDLYEFGTIILDIRRTEVTRDGKLVNLTAREFSLLRYFAEHQDITISREELLREVWGHKAATLTRTVDMHVASLRHKLEPFPQKPTLIVTVSGFGYRFQS